MATLPKEAATASLPVLLFYTAMQMEMGLSDFSERVGLGTISMRQFFTGKTSRPRGKTLELFANTIGIPVDEARRHGDQPTREATPFATWLQEAMKRARASRAKLHQMTGISDGALRNYLAGKTLPDPDQAQRLTLALNGNSLEVARSIMADTMKKHGVPLAPPEPKPEPAAPKRASAPAPAPLEEEPEESIVAEAPVAAPAPAPAPVSAPAAAAPVSSATPEEERLLHLWRQLHPQGRRAALLYIAGLFAEG
ncbi:MAG: helix-turn-helix domain-containing protein [Chloroflexaceae bacterium]|jgi:transcriptional regulator with XRE-family HTH domain|nr:helix-turn-helix domain-containing protein [Chloroflexaceae bacterium]